MCPNLWVMSDLTLDPSLKFECGPYISLIISRRGLDVKTTYGKSCAPKFWVDSDLTFDPSFKVERGP